MPRRYKKILVLATEDWFALSHFQPLISTLTELADEVVVAARSSGRLEEIAALGCRAVAFDYQRAMRHPVTQAGVVRRLVKLIADERPDVIHSIAIQTMLVLSLALRFAPPVPHTVLHLTGLGLLGSPRSRASKVMRVLVPHVLAKAVRDPANWLMAENPDDVEFLLNGGADPGARVTILGGAGIDPDAFPAQLPGANPVPVAAFVGRMIRSKGVDVLMDAHALLRGRGVALDIALYGTTDDDNPEAIPRAELERWTQTGGVTWAGRVTDIVGVWARSDIAVAPSLAGEGLPRAVLEAASCARPLVVTDTPGCRHMVRNGVEGLVVPPSDPEALAEALGRLATDRAMRSRMGRAARERILGGFTVAHLKADLRATYARLGGPGSRAV